MSRSLRIGTSRYGGIAIRAALVGAAVAAAACADAGNDARFNAASVLEAAKGVRQTPLDGSTVPKYVEAMPLVSNHRVSGTSAVTVDMVEFQQKILPASFYQNLQSPFNAGAFQWGYAVNNEGPHWPSATIEVRQGTATSVTFKNDLRGSNNSAPVLQKYMTQDLTLHWADPQGVTSANACQNGPPLATQCLQPYGGPIPTVAHLHGAEVPSQFDGHPDSWFTPGLSLKGAAF